MEFLSNCNSSNEITSINYNKAVIILSILRYYALPDNGSFRLKLDVSKSFPYILINISTFDRRFFLYYCYYYYYYCYYYYHHHNLHQHNGMNHDYYKKYSIKIYIVFNSNMFECHTYIFNKTDKEYLACVHCMFNTFSCSVNNTSQ